MKLQLTKGSSLVLATILGLLSLSLGGCASTSSKAAQDASASAGAEATADHAGLEAAGTSVARGPQGPLICKARKSKFRFDWQAASPNAAEGQFDQNSVSFDFKAANRPAGERGENLKVGECGWAAAPMVPPSLKAKSAQASVPRKVSYKRLSEEATETFYKLRTGKVFKVPVRQGKNVLTVPAGAPVTIIR